MALPADFNGGEMSTVSEAPRLDVRFDDPEFTADPYRFYELIRAAGPVVYSAGPVQKEFAPDDGYMCAGHKACQRVLGNVRKYRQPEEWYSNKFGDVVFEGLDTPRHDQIRGVWAHDFERDTLSERWRQTIDEMIQRYLEPVAERLESGETVDIASELHAKVPLLLTLQMLGLPESDSDMLRAWTETLTGAGQVDGTMSLNDYVEQAVDEKERAPGDDLITTMVASDAAGTMTRREVVANCSQIVFAGAGTTTGVMNSCVSLLGEHPDQRRALGADRSLIPQAIEEAVRFRSVALAAPRMVVDGDAELEGVRIPEGSTMVLLIGAANRDPSRWDRPGEFDIFRERKQHLGFGFGMHNCLGLNLGRLIVGVYLNRLLDRIPNWEPAGPSDAQVPRRGQRLPITAPAT